jgi:uncharacterized protein
MSRRQVLALHGGTVYPTRKDFFEALVLKEPTLEDLTRKGWRSNLGMALGEGFSVYAPSMPIKEDARYTEWKVWFEKILGLMDDGLILVGHSLGGAFLVKYLAENVPAKRISATFLVSAPYADPALMEREGEYLADFLLTGNITPLAERAGEIFLYHSEDDAVVPVASVEHFARALPRATVRRFRDRGHFLQEEFPELVADIRLIG